MKIHVISTGKTTIDADRDYEEPPIRAALEELAELGPDETGRYLPDVAVAIVDHTGSERSDISHDEYATVTEDDGTVLWSGWLDGRDEPAPDAPAPDAGLPRRRSTSPGTPCSTSRCTLPTTRPPRRPARRSGP